MVSVDVKQHSEVIPLSTPLCPCPGDRWCDVLGIVPAGSVSNSSILQIFRGTSLLTKRPICVRQIVSFRETTLDKATCAGYTKLNLPDVLLRLAVADLSYM